MNLEPHNLPLAEPPEYPAEQFDNAEAAVARLKLLYDQATDFLKAEFQATLAGRKPQARYRAYYPEICLTTTSFAHIDSRLSFGHVAEPGTYSTTITRPELFDGYLVQQIGLILASHQVPVTVRPSTTPIPVHFALQDDTDVAVGNSQGLEFHLRDVFDVPDLATTNDQIVNGFLTSHLDGPSPLAPFTAQRIDYSLARLSHYTATAPTHFQNFVLFTNYKFYVDEFARFAEGVLADPTSGYTEFVAPGNKVYQAGETIGETTLTPQMPAFHLKRANGNGITLVNIGVGPSNAKTATDHIAVLRPHTWLMLGHCAGLRNSQSLGDFVLAHAYLREDHVLDADLPVWVPVPALSEIQIALENAVAEVTKLTGYDLKRIMRTGTVATIDNRNWELRDQSGPVQRLSQSRAIALDMESATIAANGFRFRVPYGTLLCVSDKPLHGELKLPGIATEFYSSQVSRHLKIGIRALESLRDMPLERLHSRKLRTFEETAFL